MDHMTTFSQIFTSFGDGDLLFAVPLGTDSELRARMFAAWSVMGRVAKHRRVLENIALPGISKNTIALSCCSSTEISVRYLQGHRIPIRGSRDYVPL